MKIIGVNTKNHLLRVTYGCTLRVRSRSISGKPLLRAKTASPYGLPTASHFYYLSEENGTFNVYQRVSGTSSAIQVTYHTKQPVRFLSMANDGRLCYGYDGEIYTMTVGRKPQKVNVNIVSDKTDKDLIRQIRNYGATEMAVSPGGKEVAFILRGDVYVTSVDYKTTKQITNTPCQERDIDFGLPMVVLWFMLLNETGFGNSIPLPLCVKRRNFLHMPRI